MNEIKYIKSNKKSTLVLNNAWLPSRVFTAKNAIRVLLTGGAMALDKNYMQHNFASWVGELHHDQRFDNEQYIRGPHRDFRVPSILIAKNMGFRRSKTKKKMPSLHELHLVYGGVCQYCFEDISLKESTREHVIPRALGGTSEDCNIVLACRDCNNKKADQYPYMNSKGSEVRPIYISGMINTLMTMGTEIRDEWKPFIFKK